MSDLIDREALLRQIDIDSEGEPGFYGDTWQFIDTIKRMPSAHGTNLAEVGTELISRQAAIEAMGKATWAKERLAELPPAESKRGRWIHDGSKWTNRWICSECGYKWFFDCIEGAYCPNCGADMRGEQG